MGGRQRRSPRSRRRGGGGRRPVGRLRVRGAGPPACPDGPRGAGSSRQQHGRSGDQRRRGIRGPGWIPRGPGRLQDRACCRSRRPDGGTPERIEGADRAPPGARGDARGLWPACRDGFPRQGDLTAAAAASQFTVPGSPGRHPRLAGEDDGRAAGSLPRHGVREPAPGQFEPAAGKVCDEGRVQRSPVHRHAEPCAAQCDGLGGGLGSGAPPRVLAPTPRRAPRRHRWGRPPWR